jgi:hypothetical protein
MYHTACTINTTFVLPEAFICINKSRKKIKENNIYLNDGDEYQIELFNPLTTTILAKIDLDGKSLGSGIVLKPGVRLFLERFLDSNKKFKFSTYEVETNSTDVDTAISNNGKIIVSFYAEKLYYTNFLNNDWFNINRAITCNNILYSNTTTNTSFNLNNSFKETGTTDKGNISEQKFTEVNIDFEYNSFHIINYKVLPKSLEIIEKKDIKIYCSNCGRKSKDNENYCPKCGNKM